MSTTLPSVVTTAPMVACSAITFRVPSSAASSKGMSWSNQGVRTIRASSPSLRPSTPGIR